ncbi:hypothetical protein G6541_12460 [Streptomyces albidoflavus]|nr:hypothetical protein [Streptomyces albidoflavus]
MDDVDGEHGARVDPFVLGLVLLLVAAGGADAALVGVDEDPGAVASMRSTALSVTVVVMTAFCSSARSATSPRRAACWSTALPVSRVFAARSKASGSAWS